MVKVKKIQPTKMTTISIYKPLTLQSLARRREDRKNLV